MELFLVHLLSLASTLDSTSDIISEIFLIYRPAVPQVNHDAENVRETDLLIDNMFEQVKADDIKAEIISELQKSIEKLFQDELPIFKAKYEKLISKSYANSIA